MLCVILCNTMSQCLLHFVSLCVTVSVTLVSLCVTLCHSICYTLCHYATLHFSLCYTLSQCICHCVMVSVDFVTMCVVVCITACNMTRQSNVPTGQPRYLSSLFLVGSSLSEDVSQFDFSTGAHVIPTLHSHQQTQNRTSQVNNLQNCVKELCYTLCCVIHWYRRQTQYSVISQN